MHGQRAMNPADLDAMFAKGCKLSKKYLVFDGGARRTPSPRAIRKLNDAIACFECVLQATPQHWQSMWLLGKVHQAMGYMATSLTWFKRAFEIAPEEPDIAREASVASLHVGDTESAIQFCQAALRASPMDTGLSSNLAIACLLAGDAQTALRHVEAALEFNPHDPVSRNVHQLIRDVIEGRRQSPMSYQELMAA